MLDAHCHLDDPRFDEDCEHVMDAARRAGVSGFIVAGAVTWERAKHAKAAAVTSDNAKRLFAL